LEQSKITPVKVAKDWPRQPSFDPSLNSGLRMSGSKDWLCQP